MSRKVVGSMSAPYTSWIPQSCNTSNQGNAVLIPSISTGFADLQNGFILMKSSSNCLVFKP